MKKMIRLATALFLSGVLLTTTSCQKDKEDEVITLEQQLLTAKTWQIEEVSTVTPTGTDVSYKRGAENNEDDYSLVRQSFKRDGSITYIDQFGDAGTNGRYQLMSNKMMRLSLEGLSTIVSGVSIRENHFSYKLETGESYTQFTFSPVQ